jgi:PBP1b-binding outer membrane lipoprotein LpoB
VLCYTSDAVLTKTKNYLGLGLSSFFLSSCTTLISYTDNLSSLTQRLQPTVPPLNAHVSILSPAWEAGHREYRLRLH